MGGVGTYTYDAFGRQTVIPAVDTPVYANAPGGVPAGSHDVTLGYYDDDLARTISPPRPRWVWTPAAAG